ncbi:MAG: VgrG-related protein, partial [Anaerolineae bacterium]|nr:VgrG-related protein [Anaerolineae bacterium]
MTTATPPRIMHIKIAVNGTALSKAIMDQLVSVEVDQTLSMPARAIVRLRDADVKLTNITKPFEPGSVMAISLPSGTTNKVVFAGEVTGIETEFGEDLIAHHIITAYDKLHRLMRPRTARKFVKTKDSDNVTSIAGQYGLTVEVEDTGIVRAENVQEFLSDFELLQALALRNGFVFYINPVNNKLLFKNLPATPTIMLKWGETLRYFRPRLTLAGQSDKAEVRGWDAVKKAAIVGTSSSSTSHATTGFGQSGGSLAKSAFGTASYVEIQRGVENAKDAENLAKSLLDHINSESVEAEGLTYGDAAIQLGVALSISEVGPRFSGTYKPTGITHYYDGSGYFTRFRVEGLRGQKLAGGTGGGLSDPQRLHLSRTWPGVVPAVITKVWNSDQATKSAGYVCVKFPWLDDKIESVWARVVFTGGGANRGIYWLPEVDDEVLVAFESGDFNRPYVLGGLYNGKDAPPIAQNKSHIDGKTQLRLMKTRLGHTFGLNDEGGKEQIFIKDST